jgi:membrane protein DedA with SNARE-associated domain
MDPEPVTWAVAGSLLLSALGLPLPENPLLIGGGVAISEGLSSRLFSLPLWFAAIVLGDLVLYAIAYGLFTRPRVARILVRLAGAERLALFQDLFATRGAWTLFLARFTYGLRAVAYVAAGAAHFSPRRFVLVDSLAVGLQLLLFVGLGHYAGGQVEWARQTSGRLVAVLAVLALLTLGITWGSTLLVRRMARR